MSVRRCQANSLTLLNLISDQTLNVFGEKMVAAASNSKPYLGFVTQALIAELIFLMNTS